MILIRTATTTELKELHFVKRPFKKERWEKKTGKKGRNKIKAVIPMGQDHLVQHLTPARIIWEERERKKTFTAPKLLLILGNITDRVTLSPSHLDHTFLSLMFRFCLCVLCKYIFWLQCWFKNHIYFSFYIAFYCVTFPKLNIRLKFPQNKITSVSTVSSEPHTIYNTVTVEKKQKKLPNFNKS